MSPRPLLVALLLTGCPSKPAEPAAAAPPPPPPVTAKPTPVERDLAANTKYGCRVPVSGPCHSLANTAKQSLQELRVAEAAPAPKGGGIRPGLYELVELKRLTGPGGPTGPTGYSERHLARIEGNCIYGATESGGEVESVTITGFEVQGTDVVEQALCPHGTGDRKEFRVGHTTEGDRVTIYIPNGRTKVFQRIGD